MHDTSSHHDIQPLGSARSSTSPLGVVLVAAGNGTRLGAGVPKAFVELAGKPLLLWSIVTITSLSHGGHLVVVAPETHLDAARALCEPSNTHPHLWHISVVPGGSERHHSVRRGLQALPAGTGTVLIHDAARPLAPASLFMRILETVTEHGESVIPALPIADTLKRVDTHGIVHETVDRATVVAVQTPQGFPYQELLHAHLSLHRQTTGVAASTAHTPSLPLPSDDAEMMQRVGRAVRTVPGEAAAHKLTTAHDSNVLLTLLSQRTHPLHHTESDTI